MSERLSIQPGKTGAIFVDAPDDGHGATGQVKKASFWGREVKVQGHKMNAGSLIDFLNTKAPDGKKLEKGWFFGLGGSSNKEIQDLFDNLYPNEVKTAFVNMKNEQGFGSYGTYPEYFKSHPEIKVLVGFDSDTSVKGVFLKPLIDNDPYSDWILCICIPQEEYNKSTLEQFLKDAIKQIGDKDLTTPTYYVCDYDQDQVDDVKEWQKRNGLSDSIREENQASEPHPEGRGLVLKEDSTSPELSGPEVADFKSFDKPKIDEAKKSFVQMNPTDEPVLKDSSSHLLTMFGVGKGLIAQSERITVLTPKSFNFNPSEWDIFEGILLKQGDTQNSNAKPTLHICLEEHRFGTDMKDTVDKVLAPLLEEAMEKLAELDLPKPTDVCCDYGHDDQIKYVEQWQQQNGRI